MFSCAKHTRNWAYFCYSELELKMQNAECKMQNRETRENLLFMDRKIFLRFPETVAKGTYGWHIGGIYPGMKVENNMK